MAYIFTKQVYVEKIYLTFGANDAQIRKRQ